MIYLVGKKIDLKSYTKEEYHTLWKNYIPDPIMDPNTYVYRKEVVDLHFETLLKTAEWYPRLGIFLKDGTVIGELSIKNINKEQKSCEIGLALMNDSVKGLGYGSEAVRLALSYIVNTLGLKKIYGDTMGNNIRMQKIFEKLGFRLIEQKRHYYDMYNRYEDRLEYLYTHS